MYLIACGVLLAIAAALNLRDWRGLCLSLLVGVNVLLPMPMNTAEAFYSACIAAEVTVLLGALFVFKCRASEIISYASAFLVLSHFMGYSLDAGSNPLSQYRAIVKILEVTQLLACVAFSPVVAPILRNRDAKTT